MTFLVDVEARCPRDAVVHEGLTWKQVLSSLLTCGLVDGHDAASANRSAWVNTLRCQQPR